jgi:hypothetical protein
LVKVKNLQTLLRLLMMWKVPKTEVKSLQNCQRVLEMLLMYKRNVSQDVPKKNLVQIK